MSVTDYRTVTSSNPATLIREVNKLIGSGWQPLAGHISGSYGSGAKLSQVMVKGSGTSYTEYELLCSSNAETLNIMVSQAIAAGWDVRPGGVGSGSSRSLLCQPMTKGQGAVQPGGGTLDKTFIDGLENVASLRARAPAYNGERIYVKGHTTAGYGQGWFVGKLSKTGLNDDGGYVITGSNYSWRRDMNIEDLEAEHFGAVPGGVVDCGPAIKALYEFLLSTWASTQTDGRSTQIGIQLPAGKVLVNPLDMRSYGGAIATTHEEYDLYPTHRFAAGHFILRGKTTSFGRQIATVIVSDKSANPVFAINHRYFTLKDFEFDGQQTTAQDSTTKLPLGATSVNDISSVMSNVQDFLVNDAIGGVFAKGENLRFSNVGGTSIYYKDSLDSKFDQFYSGKTGGPVIKVGWSNRPTGSWDHSTAIELTNFNLQNPYGPALWIPRHGQGLIRNGWIEHGYIPCDLNNGQWHIEAFSIEDCAKDAVFYNNRTVQFQFSNPTGVKLDRTTTPSGGSWYSYPTNPDGSAITAKQSDYEMGSVLMQNYGTYFDHPIRPQWTSGILRGPTNSSTKQYLNIGRFQMTATGTHWVVEIECRSTFGGTGTNPLPVTADRSGGTTHIHIVRGSGKVPTVTYWHEGDPGIDVVGYIAQDFNDILPALWVRLPATQAEYNVTVRGSGVTRAEAGTWARFTPDGTLQTAAPTNLVAATGRVSLHNGTAGIGVHEDVIGLKSKFTPAVNKALTTTGDFSQEPVEPNITGFIDIIHNGVRVAMPVYSWKPVMTVSNPTTLNVATGGTLSISATVTDAQSYQWQKSTDGTTWTSISGATATTYSKASVTSADAGQYRLAYRSYDGSGTTTTAGAAVTRFGPATTVTVN